MTPKQAALVFDDAKAEGNRKLPGTSYMVLRFWRFTIGTFWASEYAAQVKVDA